MIIINIGARGSGKTTITTKLIEIFKRSKPESVVYVWDINGEYPMKSNTGDLQKIDDFLRDVNYLNDSCIVIEEATIHFDSKGRKEKMIQLLVRARHTRNMVILNFHSFRSVPENILEHINILNTTGTKDNPTKVKIKFKDYDEIIKIVDMSKDIKPEKLENGVIINYCSWDTDTDEFSKNSFKIINKKPQKADEK